jgi:hypothetical protein
LKESHHGGKGLRLNDSVTHLFLPFSTCSALSPWLPCYSVAIPLAASFWSSRSRIALVSAGTIDSLWSIIHEHAALFKGFLPAFY